MAERKLKSKGRSRRRGNREPERKTARSPFKEGRMAACEVRWMGQSCEAGTDKTG